MSAPYLHATADEMALAVVLACKETGEDPIACVSAKEHSLGRFIAIDALRLALPDCNKSAMARGTGFGRNFNQYSGLLNNRKGALGAAWPVEAVERIAEAVAALHPETEEIPEFLPPVTVGMGLGFKILERDGVRWREPVAKPKARLPDESLPPRVVIANAVATSVTSDLMGDPAPGRSALDQRKGRA